MERIIKYLCFFFIMSLAVHAGAQDEAFVEANALLKSEKASDAAVIYAKLLKEGNPSFALYYNAGMAYLESDSLALAILQLERAATLQPNNNDLHKNLRIANGRIEHSVSKIPDFFMLRFWHKLANLFPSFVWGFLSLLFFGVAIFGFSKWLNKINTKERKKGVYLVSLGLIFGILTLSLGYIRMESIEDNHYAIVMRDGIRLKSGPDIRSDNLSDLSQGVKVEILDHIGGWTKVLLMDKEQGWLEKEWIEKI